MADETITDDRTTKDRATDVATTARDEARGVAGEARSEAAAVVSEAGDPGAARWPTRPARRCASRRRTAPTGRPARSTSSPAAYGPSPTATPSRQETSSATPATSATASAASPVACKSGARRARRRRAALRPTPPRRVPGGRSGRRLRRRSPLPRGQGGRRPRPRRLDRERPHVGRLRRSAGVQPGRGRRSDDRAAVRRPRPSADEQRRAAELSGFRAAAGRHGRRADRTGGRLDAYPDALRRRHGDRHRRCAVSAYDAGGLDRRSATGRREHRGATPRSASCSAR